MRDCIAAFRLRVSQLLIFLYCFPVCLHAQLPSACNGTTPGISCETTCISCAFDRYTGSTAGFPRNQAMQFCGTIENAQWLGFIAGAERATFTILRQL
jgi:hypothetical protein